MSVCMYWCVSCTLNKFSVRLFRFGSNAQSSSTFSKVFFLAPPNSDLNIYLLWCHSTVVMIWFSCHLLLLFIIFLGLLPFHFRRTKIRLNCGNCVIRAMVFVPKKWLFSFILSLFFCFIFLFFCVLIYYLVSIHFFFVWFFISQLNLSIFAIRQPNCLVYKHFFRNALSFVKLISRTDTTNWDGRFDTKMTNFCSRKKFLC